MNRLMNIQSVDVPRRIVHVGHPLKTCVVNVQNWLIAWLQKILVDEDVENQKTSGNIYFRKHVSFALSSYVTRDLLTIHFGEDEIRCRKGGRLHLQPRCSEQLHRLGRHQAWEVVRSKTRRGGGLVEDNETDSLESNSS